MREKLIIKPVTVLLGVLSCAALLGAQTSSAGTIQATGTVSLNVQPDQVQLSISVTTDGQSAQQAAQLNATQTAAVLKAVNQLLGSSGNAQTTGYSVYPRYGTGGNPQIVGYTATNSLQVTSYDLSLAGPLIDAASQSGANVIGGLSFGLRDPDPTRQQALTGASKQALAHAAAIASGLGATVGSVVSAQEAGGATPVVYTGVAAGSATPVQTGYVTVTASVTVTVQLH